MKKAGPVIFLIVASILFSSEIYAEKTEAKSYQIYGTDVLMTFPDEYIVFSQDLEEAEAAASKLNMTAEAGYEYMYQNGVDLLAISADSSIEYLVFLTGTAGTFHEMTEEEFEKYYEENKTVMEDSFQAGWAGYGNVKLLQTSTLVTDDFKCIFYSSFWADQNMYQLSLMTDTPTYDLDIHMNYYPGNTEDPEGALKEVTEGFIQIVENMKIHQPADSGKTHKTLFPASGSVFEVPDNWRSSAAVNEGMDVFEIEKKHRGGEDARIFVIIQDIYDSAQKDGFTDSREALDKVYENETNMAAILGVNLSEVKTKVFGSDKYFLTREEDEDGVLLQNYIIRNGRLFMFQLNADTDSEYYAVFENVMATAKFS